MDKKKYRRKRMQKAQINKGKFRAITIMPIIKKGHCGL